MGLASAQLSMPEQQRAEVEAGAARVRKVIADAVDAVGRDVVCKVSRVDPSSLTKILDGKGMNIPPELLGTIFQLDDQRVLAAGFADLAAADIMPRRTEPLEQEVMRLRRELRSVQEHITSLLGGKP